MARGDGEGTIIKRKDGRWMGAVTIGTDPETGKPKRKFIYGKQRKEVAKKMTDLKKKLYDGEYFEPSNLKLEYWLDRWIEGRKKTIAYNTYVAYQNIIKNHINPDLGQIKLKDLKAREIQELLNCKLEEGRADSENGGLSPRTVKYIYTTLHASLKQAVKERLINRNVCKAVEVPKKQEEDKELETWTREETDIFLKEAGSSNFYILFYLALNTGMRQGELLGLKWSDIDFKKKLIKVIRQYGRNKEFKKLKTKAGKRVIPLTDDTIKKLEKHKIKQTEKKLALGEAFEDNDLICCNPIGQPVTNWQLYNEYKNIVEEAEIPYIRFHDLRHTFATLFIQAGGPIKVLQQILGHSSITVTIDTYVSVTDEMLNAAADIMEIMYKTSDKKKEKDKKVNK
ncbi:MAG: tyrosine-type recombinase/integrase [bacterium]